MFEMLSCEVNYYEFPYLRPLIYKIIKIWGLKMSFIELLRLKHQLWLGFLNLAYNS